MTNLSFARLVHSDWSKHPRGRWTVEAVREGGGWRADGPVPVGDLPAFVDDLVGRAQSARTLAGFDFPIGLPARYGARLPLPGFRAALDQFGTGNWAEWYAVAATPAEIRLERPFYPAKPGGTCHQHLLDGHRVDTIDALLRRCERGGPGSQAAGCLFWTMGAKQVGRATICGWQEVIRPALARGATLWPFDGDLEALSAGELTLCETYPADVYARLGAPFLSTESKRDAETRRRKGAALIGWADKAGVKLTPSLKQALDCGFVEPHGRDDGFDAVVGLFGMIGVTDGCWPHGAPADPDIKQWEGWILGR